MKKEEKINRWFRSDDRKQIIEELNQIDEAQGQLIKNKMEWEKHRDVKEWKKRYGQYWKRLYDRQQFLEDVIRRGDNGEPVDAYYTDTSPGAVTGKRRGRKRDEDQWNTAYNLMRTRLKNYKHTLMDTSGNIVKSRLFNRVERECGISVKTLYNNYRHFPDDIKKLLK
jgi:hypothetical protein